MFFISVNFFPFMVEFQSTENEVMMVRFDAHMQLAHPINTSTDHSFQLLHVFLHLYKFSIQIK